MRKLFNNQKGLSLIELLVSMVIAGIVFAGVISVVQNSRVAFVNEQEAGFIQENARYATEILMRDIRLAGNMGCAHDSYAHLANTIDGDLDGLFSTDALSGYEGNPTSTPHTWPSAIVRDTLTGDSDAVILRYADPETAMNIQRHTGPSAVLRLHSRHDWSVGDKLMIVDSSCRHAGLFEVSGRGNRRIVHNTGTGHPGNCTKVLYAQSSSFDCSDTPCTPVSCGGNPATAYRNGASVMSYVANAYYIGGSTVIPGMPALKRQVLTSAGRRAEELAQGVESIELQFGVDTDTTMDGDVDIFLNADQVTDWAAVIAVRYVMIFRSQTEIFNSNESITLNGVTYNDRFLRQLVSSTVRIRNRG